MNLDTSVIAGVWSHRGIIRDNWGDKLNPELIRGLAKAPVAHIDSLLGWDDRPTVMVIGSCLNKATPSTMVWGTGFLRHDNTLARPPLSICAVRGPKTRQKLAELGMSCPPVFGDPALLYPLLYAPKRERKFKYGIIHHIREIDVVNRVRVAGEDSTLYIDIRGDLRAVVDQINACQVIISSSLHGIICAHAYGIEAHWMRPSDLPMGDGFKFHDYFESVGFGAVEPVPVTEEGVIDPGLLIHPAAPPRIDGDALIDACPFISVQRKKELRDWRARLAQRGHHGAIFD